MRGLALALSSVAVERFGAEALLEAARRAGGAVERAQTSVTFSLWAGCAGSSECDIAKPPKTFATRSNSGAALERET